MSNNWVQNRFRAFQTKQAAEQQRQEWNQKAKESYDAKFDALRGRVQSDVETYNELFGGNRQCTAFMEPQYQNGFSVTCPLMGVSVQKTNSSIISIAWGTDPSMSPKKSDTLEIAADEQGEVRYRHGKEFLSDVSDASRIILDPVLCD